MLAFNHIGSLGRLGNQMFEYAALRGIAKWNGYDWMIPPPENKGIENYSLHDCFKLSPDRNEGILDPCGYTSEPHFHFSKELVDTVEDNTSLYGFFQSWRYFYNVKDELREDFTFHDGILEPCKEILDAATNEVEINADIDHNGALNTSGNLVCAGSGTFSGDVIAFSSSDINLKKDITPIDNALDMINRISGNTFTWNTSILDLTPYENGTKDTGILAQEVEALGLPGLTTTRGDGVKAVRYDRLIPVLIEAIKELKSKVEDLQK